MPQDETGRRPDLSDLDSFAGVDELGAQGYEDDDDTDPELNARDTAFDAGGGSRGGIGGVGQLGDNLATGPVPDMITAEDAELHELDDQGAPEAYGHPDGPEARRELMAVEAELNQRWPETKIEPSLTRISALVQLLGEPNRGYPVLHVAGTNGKGSTARMIDALLTRMGLRVGRYTSPHLQLVTERIALDGHPISAARYAELWHDLAPYVAMVDGAAADGVAMSKFEILTGMAFAAFADAPVEAAVIEAGLGGAWDATNVADAEVAVITPIGLDHIEYLGPDILGAAREKAGIIKPGSVAVIAEQDPEVQKVLLDRAVEVDASVARAGERVRCAGARDRRRRADAEAAGPRRGLRRDLPAAARRPPGPERRARAGRRRGVLRRGQGQAAGHGGRARGVRGGREPEYGSSASARRRRCCSTPRTTRTAPARWPRPWPRSSRSAGWSASSA